VNLKLLAALNVAHSDSDLLSYIDFLVGEIENGNIAPKIDGDAIVSLYLTPVGKAMLPPTLPAATA
jgi:hypothetical protein